MFASVVLGIKVVDVVELVIVVESDLVEFVAVAAAGTAPPSAQRPAPSAKRMTARPINLIRIEIPLNFRAFSLHQPARPGPDPPPGLPSPS